MSPRYRLLRRSQWLEHNQCRSLFLLCSPWKVGRSIALVFLRRPVVLPPLGIGPPTAKLDRAMLRGVAVKEQLEKLVLQMYRSGIRYSEAVREFQSVSFLPYCESKERIRLGLRRNWGCTATPCGALFGISNSTSGRYVLPPVAHR